MFDFMRWIIRNSVIPFLAILREELIARDMQVIMQKMANEKVKEVIEKEIVKEVVYLQHEVKNLKEQVSALRKIINGHDAALIACAAKFPKIENRLSLLEEKPYLNESMTKVIKF